MHPAVSLAVTLFLTLMIVMPLAGLFIAHKKSASKNTRLWFVAIAVDGLQIPLIALKASYPSWLTYAFPGFIPVTFFMVLSRIISAERDQKVANDFRSTFVISGAYLATTSAMYVANPNTDFYIQVLNNLLFILFSVYLFVSTLNLARSLKSRGMYLVSVGFATGLLGYVVRAWTHLVNGAATPTFEFGMIANFQVWSASINVVLMTFGYLGYALERAQEKRLEMATKAAEAEAEVRAQNEYSAQLNATIQERDRMVMVNSRFLNLNALAIFNSAIVHEISQPLQAVLMCLEGIRFKDNDNGGALAQDIQNAIALTEKAGSIISVLRNTMTQGDIDLVPVDIKKQINEILPVIKGEASQNKVTIRDTFDTQDLICNCNAMLLHRLVFNLIANAIDSFNNAGTREPCIDINVEKQSFDSHDYAVISIADNGPGLSQIKLTEIFEPFKTSKVDGMGVGLSLAQILLRKWGGTIRAEAVHPSGLRIVFKIPLLTNN